MKFRLVKTNTGFRAETDEDQEKLNKLSIGEVFSCSSLDQRNVEFHRKFFALIHLAWDNLPIEFEGRFPTQDDLRKELTKRAGFYTEYTDFKGNKQYLPKSISFDKMGQEQFEKLYSAVIDIILQWLIPGLDRELLEHEIMTFLS